MPSWSLILTVKARVPPHPTLCFPSSPIHGKAGKNIALYFMYNMNRNYSKKGQFNCVKNKEPLEICRISGNMH